VRRSFLAIPLASWTLADDLAASCRVGDVKSAITDYRHAVQLDARDVVTAAKLAFILDIRGADWLQVRSPICRSF
jgi:Flp pilus assembly protein TadD